MRIKDILSARVAFDANEGMNYWEYFVAWESETKFGEALVPTWEPYDSLADWEEGSLEPGKPNMIAIDQFWRAESTPHRWIELREVGEEVKPATNVYALRPGLSCFYPAIVQAKIHNGKFLVSFPDGAMAEVQLRDMRKDELRVGDRVFNWRFRPYGSETRRVTKIKAGMITTDGSYGGDRAHRIDLALSVHDIEWQAWGDRMFKEDCEVVCMYGRE